MRFLAVEYRLELRNILFPRPSTTRSTCFCHVVTNWSDYAAPDAEMLVMGDSAGASLVAVAAALREMITWASQPSSLHPDTQTEMVTESAHKYGVGYMLDLEHLRDDSSGTSATSPITPIHA